MQGMTAVPPLIQWIQGFEFKTILDIGANTGQFARQFRTLFPQAMMYSFEPLPACFEALESAFAADENFQAFNLALGDRNGRLEMIPNAYSPTSSFLPMRSVCKANFPIVTEEPALEVAMVRLDDLDGLSLRNPLLIKIDVQGFEDRVLVGGPRTIRQADMLIVEMSFVALYEGSLLFDDMHARLRQLGFEYRGNFETIHSMTTGEVLQIDAIYRRVD